uniref:DDE Tnp4 domain-containing protein n=1 Tax=Ditylenchus dipsaci TaxID=166011 RepID=A0A915DE62_9BILA
MASEVKPLSTLFHQSFRSLYSIWVGCVSKMPTFLPGGDQGEVEEEKLIDAVRLEPSLYDQASEGYKLAKNKQLLWDKFAKELGFIVEWGEHRAVVAFYSSLSFLNKQMEERRAHRSLLEKEVAKETNDEEIFKKTSRTTNWPLEATVQEFMIGVISSERSEKISSFFFLGDGAFPLGKHLMKPYSRKQLSIEERIYNHRLLRGRRVIKNVFGIMAAKWRILLKPIETSDRVADNIVKAICCLHNFHIDERSGNHLAGVHTGLANEDDGLWRREVQQPLQQLN